MTDKYHTLTVVLEKDTREDDAEALLNAIGMFKGVVCVKGNVSDIQSMMAESRAIRHFGNELWNILYPEVKS